MGAALRTRPTVTSPRDSLASPAPPASCAPPHPGRRQGLVLVGVSARRRRRRHGVASFSAATDVVVLTIANCPTLVPASGDAAPDARAKARRSLCAPSRGCVDCMVSRHSSPGPLRSPRDARRHARLAARWALMRVRHRHGSSRIAAPVWPRQRYTAKVRLVLCLRGRVTCSAQGTAESLKDPRREACERARPPTTADPLLVLSTAPSSTKPSGTVGNLWAVLAPAERARPVRQYQNRVHALDHPNQWARADRQLARRWCKALAFGGALHLVTAHARRPGPPRCCAGLPARCAWPNRPGAVRRCTYANIGPNLQRVQARAGRG